MSTSNSSILIEQPCYTLINMPQDAEQPSEMKLREDLEKGDAKVGKNNIIFMKCLIFKLKYNEIIGQSRSSS